MFPTERLVTSFGNFHPPCFKCSKCALRKVSKKSLNRFYHQLSVLRPPWTRRALAMENFSASVVTQGVCHAIVIPMLQSDASFCHNQRQVVTIVSQSNHYVTLNENRERSVSRRAGEEEEGSLTFTRALNDTASILAPEGDTDRCPR